MRKKIIKTFFLILASLSSGVLLCLTFPAHEQPWLAWVGLVPLLLALSNQGPVRGFFLSYASGLTFFPCIFHWIFNVPGYTVLHHLILGLYLGAYFAVFGLGFCFTAKRWNISVALFAAPFIWTVQEYIRSNLFFLAFPWGLLGHSQYQFTSLIQIVSLTGTYGLSFLIVLVNTTITAVILHNFSLGEQRSNIRSAYPSRKGAITMVGVTLILLSATLVYGKAVLSKNGSDKKIKLDVLQGNIEQSKKWDPQFAKFIMNTYCHLSMQASHDHPSLIIWPEASTPGFVLKKHALYQQTVNLIKKTHIYYLIGSSEYPKFQKAPLNPTKCGNTALFFSPEGKILGQHLKIHLVPFGEYIPLENSFSWPHFIVANQKKIYTIPGKEFNVFTLEGVRFGTLICWETLFPGLSREFVKKGANFIINIANDAWFGESAFSYQFLAITTFRAIENRVSIARAANTGISCFIDPYGRITDRIRINNKDLYVRGYLTRDISLSDEKTFYTRHGDIFEYLAITVTLLMMILSFFKEKGE